MKIVLTVVVLCLMAAVLHQSLKVRKYKAAEVGRVLWVDTVFKQGDESMRIFGTISQKGGELVLDINCEPSQEEVLVDYTFITCPIEFRLTGGVVKIGSRAAIPLDR